jgi:hypothetical protein
VIESVAWCLVHRSIVDPSFGCLWDRVAGPRPGRGECKVAGATITLSEEAK